MSENKNRPLIHILLADDDEDDRTLFKQTIDEIDARVELSTVRDGNVLMHALSEIEWLPDVIFLDLNVPYVAGADCLAVIRRDEKLKHIPVVIFSTSRNEKDIKEIYNKGANLYVCKPLNFSEQKALFKRLLSINWLDFLPYSSRDSYFINEKTNYLNS